MPSHRTSLDVLIEGTAHVGLGTPNVAYIYIIDLSASTADIDGPCGTVLQCVQDFFSFFHKETIQHGSAELVGVIDYDSHATVTAELQHPSKHDAIEGVI